MPGRGMASEHGWTQVKPRLHPQVDPLDAIAVPANT
jgi:hypothetical protein